MQSGKDDTTIRVQILFFGAARDAALTAEAELKLTPPFDSAHAFEQVLKTYPELRRFGRSLLFAVNQEYVRDQRSISEGDELAFFPPVSGGSGETPAETSSQTENRIEDEGTANAGSADVSSAPASTSDFFELTLDPIDVGAVARRVVLPECGATVTLDGYAREWTRGRRTLYLVYEAYAPMAQGKQVW